MTESTNYKELLVPQTVERALQLFQDSGGRTLWLDIDNEFDLRGKVIRVERWGETQLEIDTETGKAMHVLPQLLAVDMSIHDEDYPIRLESVDAPASAYGPDGPASQEEADEVAESEAGMLHGQAHALHIKAAEAHEHEEWNKDRLLLALRQTEAANVATVLAMDGDDQPIPGSKITPATWNQMAVQAAQRGDHITAARSHRLAADSHEAAANVPELPDLLPQGEALGRAFLSAVKTAEDAAGIAIAKAYQGDLAEAQHHGLRSQKAAQIAEKLSEVLLATAGNAADEALETIENLPGYLFQSKPMTSDQPFPLELREGMLAWVEARMDEWKQKEWVIFLCEELGEGRIANILADYSQELDEADQENQIESVQAELNRDQNLGQEDES